MKIFAVLAALIISLVPAVICRAVEAPRYAVAILPAPVLNTPDFGGVFGGPDGSTLRTDSCGQLRSLEFVALPGTPFRIEAVIRRGNSVVYRVTTDDYPYPTTTGYFIDNRFVTTTPDPPPPRPRTLPPRATIIASLLDAQGSAYVWGGNLRNGIPEMLVFFPPPRQAQPDPKTSGLRQLRGVDCSGLLYEATGGVTPRNTSALIDFGAPVPIDHSSAAAIVRQLEPLDLIAWQGHVLIVLDRERVIESRLDCSGKPDGVRVRPLLAALIDIMKSRTPVDDFRKAAARGVKGFVVRRWYPRDQVRDWGLGTGDWGLGTGNWELGTGDSGGFSENAQKCPDARRQGASSGAYISMRAAQRRGQRRRRAFFSVFFHSAQQESLLTSRLNPWAQSRNPSPNDG